MSQYSEVTGCRSMSQYSCTAEAALEAWLDCETNGYVLSQGRVAELMPIVAAHLAAPRGARRPDADIFMQLLRPRDGEVHFLYFWKAFGEMARMAGAPPDDGLASELETLRDEVLRRLEEAARGGGEARCEVPFAGAELPPDALVQELHRAAGMSACPRFWQAIAVGLDRRSGASGLRLQETTQTLLDWLRELVIWESNAAALAGGDAPKSQVPGQGGFAVVLHIYDVSKEESIQKLNHVLANEASPVKLGGVFHAGVEVNGLEWSFSYCNSATRTGISCTKPKMHPNHHYRETVLCGWTALAADEVTRIISELVEDYPGQSYSLLRQNCCHFADDFARRLGTDGIPGWVHRLARIGASVETMLLAAQSVKEALTGTPSEPLPWRRQAPPRAVRARGGGGPARGARSRKENVPLHGPPEALGDRAPCRFELDAFGQYQEREVPLCRPREADGFEFGAYGQPRGQEVPLHRPQEDSVEFGEFGELGIFGKPRCVRSV